MVPFLSKCYFNYPAAYKLAEMDALSQVLAFLRRTPGGHERPSAIYSFSCLVSALELCPPGVIISVALSSLLQKVTDRPITSDMDTTS